MECATPQGKVVVTWPADLQAESLTTLSPWLDVAKDKILRYAFNRAAKARLDRVVRGEEEL
jgi:hypothetical protein